MRPSWLVELYSISGYELVVVLGEADEGHEERAAVLANLQECRGPPLAVLARPDQSEVRRRHPGPVSDEGLLRDLIKDTGGPGLARWWTEEEQ